MSNRAPIAAMAITLACVSLLPIARRAAPSEPSCQGRPASAWIVRLAHDDAAVRREAQSALGQLRANAIPALAHALRHREIPLAALWRRCQRRWPALGPEAPEAARVRQCAAAALADLGSAAEPALADLVSALGDRDALVAGEAQRALRRQGRAALGPLARALARGGERVSILRALADLGPDAADALPAVVARLSDRDADSRAAAVTTVAAIARRDPAVERHLDRALGDPASSVRAAAAKALASAVGTDIPNHDKLRRLLADPSSLVRFEAARTLMAHREPLEDLLPTFIALLPEPGVGWQTALVLGAVGPAAAPAIPALIQALRRERVPRPLRTPPTATIALGQIGVAACDPLAQLLRAPEAPVRTGALLALGMLGPQARAAAERIVPLLADHDAEVRQAAALSLGRIDPETAGVASALERLTHEDEMYVSAAAAHLLRQRQAAALDPQPR